MTDILFSKLINSFKGQVITPDDGDYDSARTIFYREIDKKPAAIIRVADSDDIKKAVLLARDSDLPLAIRSGGHSYAGYSMVDKGIVIDLRHMKRIEVDSQDGTVWGESGATASQLTNAVDKYDSVLGFGDTGSVGIGGITLGGGIGYLVRKFGMTIDNLLAAEIVTADGKLILTDADHYPDLFWAIRGGGGNFGVATRFKYRLHPLKQGLGGILLLPATPEVIAGFMAEADRAPLELSTIANVMPTPPMPFVPKEWQGKLSMMALMMYSGSPEKGTKVLAPFRALAEPIADMVKPIRYKEMFFPEDDSYHPTAVAKTMMLNHVDLPLAKQIVKQLESVDAPMKVVQLRTLGGAMAKIPASQTAFAHRQSKIMANVAAFYTTPKEKLTYGKWVNRVIKTMFQGDRGVYLGFLDSDGANRLADTYPGKIGAKLRTVKKKYDPENIFRNNLNISPA